ncbi:MAG: T9SS type A sorting domain-containing protein [Bacteroidetes bacterium]|nr:T9SS type A sorting domain-containing protein [Bacteroidota bacterium]
MKKIVISIIFLLLPLLFIKGQIAIGEWRDHLPYMHAKKVALSEDNVFCATGQSVFKYNISGNNLEKLSRVEGLSDIGISSINFSNELNLLLIAYENSNLDIIQDNNIINLSDIKRKQIPGLKTINNILFSDEYAYLSCSFGIVVVNIEKHEIKDTYYIGNEGARINVFDMAFDGFYLYAATEQGVFRAPYNDPNLFFYATWENIAKSGNGNIYNQIVCFRNKIFINQTNESIATDSIFIITDTTRQLFNFKHEFKNYSFRCGQDYFVISSDKIVRIFDKDLILTREIDDYGYGYPSAMDAIIDISGTIWIADGNSGLVKSREQNYFDGIYPNGPYTTNAFDLAADNSIVCAVGGGINSSWGGIYKNGEIFIFQNEQWQSILNYSVHDAVNVLIDPANSTRLYVGTWGNGILVYENGEISEHFSPSNSSLESMIPGEPYVRIGGMGFDKNHNLWVTNSGVNNPVSVKTNSGNWFSLPYSTRINSPLQGNILLTKYEHKWIVLPKGNGLFAFDEKGTFENTNDDNWRKFSVKDTEGESFNNIFSIAEDLDGNIWVGTDQGPLVYYSPENVFSENSFVAQRIKIPRNDDSGLADYMLGTETITVIEVDGANRKWIGTENAGVFLLSEDGTKQIYSFNSNNSPLFSDRISSIALDHNTGEVFFGTDKGLISFRSTSTSGSKNFNEVYVFPNPVRENYTGPVTISRLVSNVNVKITDIAGNLVFETTALGGQAIWDGKNLNGDRVQTGVYLVFCSNEDGTETHVTKLLFIH